MFFFNWKKYRSNFNFIKNIILNVFHIFSLIKCFNTRLKQDFSFFYLSVLLLKKFKLFYLNCTPTFATGGNRIFFLSELFYYKYSWIKNLSLHSINPCFSNISINYRSIFVGLVMQRIYFENKKTLLINNVTYLRFF